MTPNAIHVIVDSVDYDRQIKAIFEGASQFGAVEWLDDGFSFGKLPSPQRPSSQRGAPSEYGAWQNMNQRCRNLNYHRFDLYGGRGITICERWRSFYDFLRDMGIKPTSAHSLDRFPDKDGNYEPGNCRWATFQEQMLNRRPWKWSAAALERWEPKSRSKHDWNAIFDAVDKGESMQSVAKRFGISQPAISSMKRRIAATACTVSQIAVGYKHDQVLDGAVTTTS